MIDNDNDSLEPTETRPTYADVVSRSGVDAPGAADPAPHPNPPIDCIAIIDIPTGFTSYHYHFFREEQAVLNDVEDGLANPGPTEREVVIKARINQGVFRSRLLQPGNCCAVTLHIPRIATRTSESLALMAG